MRVTVERGGRYRAHVHLGLFEQVASDEQIAQGLRASGFVAVVVVGEGRERWAFGTWPRETETYDAPPQVLSVERIG